MKTRKVKVVCGTCEGDKVIPELTYPAKRKIWSPCPQCNGEGWVWGEEVVEVES